MLQMIPSQSKVTLKQKERLQEFEVEGEIQLKTLQSIYVVRMAARFRRHENMDREIAIKNIETIKECIKDINSAERRRSFTLPSVLQVRGLVGAKTIEDIKLVAESELLKWERVRDSYELDNACFKACQLDYQLFEKKNYDLQNILAYREEKNLSYLDIHRDVLLSHSSQEELIKEIIVKNILDKASQDIKENTFENEVFAF